VKANGPAADESWLDFGCGAGRIARHFDQRGRPTHLAGVDVDVEAVSWCGRFLRGTFKPVDAMPPTPLAEGSFDVAYSVSVFSHLDEGPQFGWLAEIHRLLRPRGLLVASTHSPSLIWTRPDLTPEQSRRLNESGFLFAPGKGRFNDDSAFHSEGYLSSAWSRYFELESFSAGGLAGYQDLSTWRKR
jgi:SAM-dependent methyltransferase